MICWVPVDSFCDYQPFQLEHSSTHIGCYGQNLTDLQTTLCTSCTHRISLRTKTSTTNTDTDSNNRIFEHLKRRINNYHYRTAVYSIRGHPISLRIRVRIRASLEVRPQLRPGKKFSKDISSRVQRECWKAARYWQRRLSAGGVLCSFVIWPQGSDNSNLGVDPALPHYTDSIRSSQILNLHSKTLVSYQGGIRRLARKGSRWRGWLHLVFFTDNPFGKLHPPFSFSLRRFKILVSHSVYIKATLYSKVPVDAKVWETNWKPRSGQKVYSSALNFLHDPEISSSPAESALTVALSV